MTDEGPRFTLSPTARRLVRSYGVLILVAIGFLLMAMMVRERPKTVPVESLRAPMHQEVALWL
jgi:hypothetical protein